MAEMTSEERVLCVLQRQQPDRVPHFEWLVDRRVREREPGRRLEERRVEERTRELTLEQQQVVQAQKLERRGEGHATEVATARSRRPLPCSRSWSRPIPLIPSGLLSSP